MRQALFASQARLLLKLRRHAELAERGRAFVQAFGGLLAAQQRAGGVPPQLPEAWRFACYVSLAAATSLAAGGTGRGRSGAPTAAAAGSLARQTSPPPTCHCPPAPAFSPAAHTTMPVRIGDSSEAEPTTSPAYPPARQAAQLDWQLGVLPSRPPAAAVAAGVEGRAGHEGSVASPGSASLYCLLGKLYCAARTELLRMGAAAGLDVPKSPAPAAMTEPQAQAPSGAAGAAPPSPPASGLQQAAGAEDPVPQLGEARSAADLAQVDLSSAQQQQPQQAAGPAAAAQAPAVKLESTVDGQPDPGTAAVAGQLQRMSLRPQTAPDGEATRHEPCTASRLACLACFCLQHHHPSHMLQLPARPLCRLAGLQPPQHKHGAVVAGRHRQCGCRARPSGAAADAHIAHSGERPALHRTTGQHRDGIAAAGMGGASPGMLLPAHHHHRCLTAVSCTCRWCRR